MSTWSKENVLIDKIDRNCMMLDMMRQKLGVNENFLSELPLYIDHASSGNLRNLRALVRQKSDLLHEYTVHFDNYLSNIEKLISLMEENDGK